MSIERIKLLPTWCITDKYPAFYDTESATAIEMVAKVYGSMRELQDDYNKYVNEINNTITEFINNVNADQECFKNEITKIMHDYIMKIDEKMKMQDLTIANAIERQDETIADAVSYMKTNIKITTQEVVNQLIQNGEITLEHTYDEENKKVSIIITNGGGNQE